MTRTERKCGYRGDRLVHDRGMARATARGELTVGSNTTIPPDCTATIAAAQTLKAKRQAEGSGTFAMDSEQTDREIKRLMGETSADGELLK